MKKAIPSHVSYELLVRGEILSTLLQHCPMTELDLGFRDVNPAHRVDSLGIQILYLYDD